jgi:hypothetical protein
MAMSGVERLRTRTDGILSFDEGAIYPPAARVRAALIALAGVERCLLDGTLHQPGAHSLERPFQNRSR